MAEQMVESVAKIIANGVGADLPSDDIARAAIEALREPTDEMCMAAHARTAGWLNLERHGSGLTQALMKAKLRYQAMIDAALKD